MVYLYIVIIISGIFYTIKRFHRNPSGSLLNPLFYMVILSLFYFIIPLIFLPFSLKVMDMEVSQRTIFKSCFLSFYYTSIFFLFYILSKDRNVRFSCVQFNNKSIKIAKIINICICILLIYIIIFRVPHILALRSSRGVAFGMYNNLIEGPFKFRLVLLFHLGIISFLFIKFKRYKYFLPLICYLIIDFSHGGRILSVIVLLFFYIHFVIDRGKSYIKYSFIAIISLIILGVLQRDSSEFQLMWKIYSSVTEFCNTYLTTVYLIEHPEYSQDISSYTVLWISRCVPGGMVGKMMGIDTWYGELLSQEIGQGYGLAGNIISESLVYGGFYLALINPILIGFICYVINNLKGKDTLAGFWFVMYLCIPIQENFRQYFWGYVLYPVQLVFFWGIWAYPDWFKKILMPINKNNYILDSKEQLLIKKNIKN